MEDKDFIGHIFEQNCGDSLKVIKISKEKPGFWICQFQKYPYEVLAKKDSIKKRTVNNPQIEQVEFIDKLWPQNCGDTLRIINRSNKKQGNAYLWECEFIKYPYKIFAQKHNIKEGKVKNPKVEENIFIGHIFKQNCGDSLLILRKTKKQNSALAFLFECEFQKYKNIVLADKQSILKGLVRNDKIIYANKENFENFLISLNKKVTIKELIDFLKEKEDISISPSSIGKYLTKFDLIKYINYCPSASYLEKDLFYYIKEYYNKEIKESVWNVLNDKEIDIYLPDLKLGFEFNGNYWHSELFKDKNYHQEKSLLAKEKGIRLIHIWEWEWEYNKDKIENFIKFQFGLFNKKIGASKCKIKNLSNQEYQDFCNENHLQGSCGAKIKLGLFYKDELVQVMSFGVPRFTDKYEWEIIRECSKLGYIIIGGKQKLWFYFVKHYHPNNCISYCDFSKFTGKSYLKLGFKFERLNKPGFWWWDEHQNIILERSPWKHQEMKDKYLKIYDTGQLVFIWNQ